jgi:diadenosine tetraphosphate (Ap4A) HIT family hydrolase
MAFIYETTNFILESKDKPEIDRLEGGHIKITPKIAVVDRTQLTPKQAIELMRFTIVSGEALVAAMKKTGVDIGRINYQDNGNWTPTFHIHLYGRAKDAKMQKYGDPIISGHKSEYKPLNEDDIKHIKDELDNLFKQEKFSDFEWGLS